LRQPNCANLVVLGRLCAHGLKLPVKEAGT
jgi:hypothetical protein